ncbi:hypothetical protein THAOC_26919, partial [Thalassiosira oceanica]
MFLTQRFPSTSQLSIMKSVAALALIGSAAAFAPAQTGKASTQLNAFEGELGSQPPLGFFDPLGLLDDADQGADSTVSDTSRSSTDVSPSLPHGNIITRAGVHLGGSHRLGRKLVRLVPQR